MEIEIIDKILFLNNIIYIFRVRTHSLRDLVYTPSFLEKIIYFKADIKTTLCKQLITS